MGCSSPAFYSVFLGCKILQCKSVKLSVIPATLQYLTNKRIFLASPLFPIITSKMFQTHPRSSVRALFSFHLHFTCSLAITSHASSTHSIDAQATTPWGTTSHPRGHQLGRNHCCWLCLGISSGITWWASALVFLWCKCKTWSSCELFLSRFLSALDSLIFWGSYLSKSPNMLMFAFKGQLITQ
jgi:hypothetical protein